MIRFSRTRLPVGISVFLAAGLLAWAPQADAAERTLASEALGAAVANGTFEEVKQAMVMDIHQKSKYEFDEEGIEALGRKLFDQGDQETAIEVLQLNQAIHGQSPRAANALGDVYRKSGNPTVARMYYDSALKLDSGNAHARQGLQELEGTAAGAEPPKSAEEVLAQMRARMSPEAAQQMQQMMQQVQQQGAEEQRGKESVPNAKGEEELLHERIAQQCAELGAKYEPFGGPAALARLTGQYGAEDDTKRLKTWNIETTCDRKALHAIPLWADVAPLKLIPDTRAKFSDDWDGAWEFQIDASGRAEGVSYTGSDGKTQRLIRLGDPYSFD
jgi:tetratricopeptide (TPR) repeat protein